MVMTASGKRNTPDRVDFEQLHELVLAGDEAAVETTAREATRVLSTAFSRLYPREDPDAIGGAVDDALVGYVSDPRQFNPSRAKLLTWLGNIVKHRLIDRWRREQTRRIDERRIDAQTPRPSQATPEQDLETAEERALNRQRILAVAKSPTDRAFLEARLDGASVQEQAKAAGAGELPLATARRLVNRRADTIRHTARRHLPSARRRSE